MSAQERFPAFGTTACVTVRAARDLGPAVSATRRVVADVDATCSRFRADSDLARVNAAPGRWTRVDPLLVAAVEVAVEAARQTGGLVNPLLGRPLVELGYDRDLAAVHLVADDGRAGAATTPVPLPQAGRRSAPTPTVGSASRRARRSISVRRPRRGRPTSLPPFCSNTCTRAPSSGSVVTCGSSAAWATGRWRSWSIPTSPWPSGCGWAPAGWRRRARWCGGGPGTAYAAITCSTPAPDSPLPRRAGAR